MTASQGRYSTHDEETAIELGLRQILTQPNIAKGKGDARWRYPDGYNDPIYAKEHGYRRGAVWRIRRKITKKDGLIMQQFNRKKKPKAPKAAKAPPPGLPIAPVAAEPTELGKWYDVLVTLLKINGDLEVRVQKLEDWQKAMRAHSREMKLPERVTALERAYTNPVSA